VVKAFVAETWVQRERGAAPVNPGKGSHPSWQAPSQGTSIAYRLPPVSLVCVLTEILRLRS
jgi:hypothetical protein